MQGKPTGSVFSIDCAAIDLVAAAGQISTLIRGWRSAWGNQIFFPAKDQFATIADHGGRVLVFGARTGALREAVLRDTQFQFLVIGSLQFRNVIRVRRQLGTFIQDGDSGSLLLLETRINGSLRVVAIGLMFAKDIQQPVNAYACHMRPVLDRLQITLPANLLVKATDWNTPQV